MKKEVVIYGVSSYNRDNPNKPLQETSENFLGYVYADNHSWPFAEDADIHVEFFGYTTIGEEL